MLRFDRDDGITFLKRVSPAQSQFRQHGTMLVMPERTPTQIRGEVEHDYPIKVRCSRQVLLVTGRELPQTAIEQDRQLEERTMIGNVWISDCRSDSTLIKMVETDIVKQNFGLGVEAGKLMLLG